MKTTNVIDNKSRDGNQKSSLDRKTKRILVADDDAGIRDVFEIIFRNTDYIVELKENGQDVLNNKFVIPDLFLIDKQLSGTCGLDICRYLKSQPKTKHIPVVIMSALPGVGKLALEAGADCFLEKPFEIKELMKLIDACISKASAVL